MDSKSTLLIMLGKGKPKLKEDAEEVKEEEETSDLEMAMR